MKKSDDTFEKNGNPAEKAEERASADGMGWMTVCCTASKASDAPIHAAGEIPEGAGGTCGEGMLWRQEDGVLYIEGEGEIDAFAFESDYSIDKLVIAPGCTGIGMNAFFDCASLREAKLPNGLKWIGSNAFSQCERLKLRVPRSVTSIDADAFSGIEALEYHGQAEDEFYDDWGAGQRAERLGETECSWRVDGDTLYIDGEGLMPLEKVEGGRTSAKAPQYELNSPWHDLTDRIRHVVIAPGCVEISPGAFSCFTKLETISIPSTVEDIGNAAFIDCWKLQSVGRMQGVMRIGDQAFERCISLRAIEIPDSVMEIGYNAFYQCEGLESIRIPAGIKVIGESAFEGCSALRDVTVSDSVTRD